MLSRPELLDRIGLTDAERRLAPSSRAKGRRRHHAARRLPRLRPLRFVEYNAENPSSLPDQPA